MSVQEPNNFTDFVRKYERLKASGLSDTQAARQLCVTTATLNLRLREHRRQQKRRSA